MDLSIILLTWNSEPYLDGCLASLAACLADSGLAYEVLVADNGSRDGTTALLRRWAAQQNGRFLVKYLPTNQGTTYPRNLLLREAQGKVLCVMDSDVEVTPGLFTGLATLLSQDPGIGIAVPKILYPSGAVQKSFDRFPTLLHKVNRFFRLRQMEARQAASLENLTGPVPVDYAISAFWLMPRSVLEQVGYLDENFFYAPEDVDYCLRVWKSGYRIVYQPALQVVHHTQEISRGWKLNRAKLVHLKGLFYLFKKHQYFFKAPQYQSASLLNQAPGDHDHGLDGGAAPPLAFCFSVIIPARNEEANIGRCLDSIAQVCWDSGRYEVLVIDNGSTDATVAIARSKGARVFEKPGLTISALRNFGASQARGEVLAFIDADCTVAPDWLERASRYLTRRDIACFGSPPGVPEQATWVQKAWCRVRQKKEPVGETDWLESMNLFLRYDLFARCGGFDERLITCEDYDLCVRLSRLGSIVNDSSIVATHHGEAATVAHFFRKERWRGISNFAGVIQHGVTLRELPSVLAPVLHCLLSAALLLAAALAPRGGFLLVVLACLAWQLLLLVRSLRAHGAAWSVPEVLQLYLLLNVYLYARGAALIRVR
jgi:glycosyltransferase involved in cell wall biosynthesis